MQIALKGSPAYTLDIVKCGLLEVSCKVTIFFLGLLASRVLISQTRTLRQPNHRFG